VKDLRWKPFVEFELLYKGLFGSQPMSQPKFCTVLNATEKMSNYNLKNTGCVAHVLAWLHTKLDVTSWLTV